MGREIRCMAEIDEWTGDGRLLLETDELIFRGARRLVVPRASITKAVDENGWLVIEHAAGSARFDLGRLTPSWVNAIVNPRSRIDKLDVTPTSRVMLVGEHDDDFTGELHARTADVSAAPDGGDLDLVFLRVESADDLDDLPALRQRLRPSGAIWIVHPRARADVKHEVIAAAARAAGLVDTKSARFSATHSALRLTIPRQQRPA